MLKSAIKHSSDADKVRHRTVPPERVAQWAEKLAQIKDEISEVLKEEKEEKAMRQAEMELKKKENIMEHEKEISPGQRGHGSRLRRTKSPAQGEHNSWAA